MEFPYTALIVSLFELALIALYAWEVLRAPPHGGEEERRPRGAAMLAAAAIVMTPIFLAVIPAMTRTRSLPVQQPRSPYAGEPWSLLDLDLDGIIYMAIAGALAIMIGLLVAAYVSGAGRAAMARDRGIPRGTRMLRAALIVALAIGLAGGARYLLGGVTPERFDTHGALTPGPTAGSTSTAASPSSWRVNRVIARAATSPFAPVYTAEPLETDSEYHGGSDCCGLLASPGGRRLVDGVMAWWNDAPVVLRVDDSNQVVVHEVRERDTAITQTGRPRFFGPLRWAHGPGDDQYIVLDNPAARSLDRGPLAVVIDGFYDESTRTVRMHQVGLLLAPPLWPLLLLVVAAFLAGLFLRGGTLAGPWAGARRLAAAWLLWAGSYTLFAVYWWYI